MVVFNNAASVEINFRPADYPALFHSRLSHHLRFVRSVISFAYFSRHAASMFASSTRAGSVSASSRSNRAEALRSTPLTISSHIALALTTPTAGTSPVTCASLWTAFPANGTAVAFVSEPISPDCAIRSPDSIRIPSFTVQAVPFTSSDISSAP